MRGDYIGARGFAYNYGQRQYKIGMTYGFPVPYPGGFGNVLYTRRFVCNSLIMPISKMTVVSDHIRSSVGAEIIFDLRFPPCQLVFGIRA